MLPRPSDLLEARLFEIVTTSPIHLVLWFIIYHSQGKTWGNCFHVFKFEEVCWLIKETNISLHQTWVRLKQRFIELGAQKQKQNPSGNFPPISQSQWAFYHISSGSALSISTGAKKLVDEHSIKKTWRQTPALWDSSSQWRQRLS